MTGDKQNHEEQVNDPNDQVRPSDCLTRLLVKPAKAQREPHRKKPQGSPLEL
jgi:hypothetical protein